VKLKTWPDSSTTVHGWADFGLLPWVGGEPPPFRICNRAGRQAFSWTGHDRLAPSRSHGPTMRTGLPAALGIAAWAREQRRQEATNGSRRSRPIPTLFALLPPPAKHPPRGHAHCTISCLEKKNKSKDILAINLEPPWAQ
jgi:hypothetical protein